jgi:hypothetical protein
MLEPKRPEYKSICKSGLRDSNAHASTGAIEVERTRTQ